jgi:hypothetical protein
MRGDLTIRTVKTASGATAVQVVQNKGKQRPFLKHFGSAHDELELEGTSIKCDLKYSRASVRWHLPATPAETNVL